MAKSQSSSHLTRQQHLTQLNTLLLGALPFLGLGGISFSWSSSYSIGYLFPVFAGSLDFFPSLLPLLLLPKAIYRLNNSQHPFSVLIPPLNFRLQWPTE